MSDEILEAIAGFIILICLVTLALGSVKYLDPRHEVPTSVVKQGNLAVFNYCESHCFAVMGEGRYDYTIASTESPWKCYCYEKKSECETEWKQMSRSASGGVRIYGCKEGQRFVDWVHD